MWFEPDLLPGYAWSFPLPDGRANVGFGIARDGGKVERVQDMRPLWPDLLARPHIRAVLGADAARRGARTGRGRSRPASTRIALGRRRRVLFVGDAAAATDPMTGEGIGQALLTGIARRRGDRRRRPGRRRRGAAARYDAGRRRARSSPTTACRSLLQPGAAPPQGRPGRAAARRHPDWTRRNFARWLFEDYPRAAALTPRRWHRRFLAPSRGVHRRDTSRKRMPRSVSASRWGPRRGTPRCGEAWSSPSPSPRRGDGTASQARR